jgi:hypothetical protein
LDPADEPCDYRTGYKIVHLEMLFENIKLWFSDRTESTRSRILINGRVHKLVCTFACLGCNISCDRAQNLCFVSIPQTIIGAMHRSTLTYSTFAEAVRREQQEEVMWELHW